MRGREATKKSKLARKAAESLQALGGGCNGEEAGRAGGVASPFGLLSPDNNRHTHILRLTDGWK